MEPDSLLVRGLVDNPSGGLSPALDRSTTFERAPGGGSPYGRGNAPVTAEAEALLSALEDAEATLFASGMTAWTCLCLTVLGQGKALVIPTSGYYEVELLGSEVLGRFGVEVRRYDLRDAEGFRRACEGAALAIIETPSNPTLTVTDIAASAQAAHAGGALLCCDNTFGTPLLQRPLDLGADLAWQSATKYLAGHSDVLAGLITTRDSALRERLVWVRRTIGGVLAPDPAWLLLRGLRTLHVRLPRSVATASELARRLAAHPAVTAVHYPGLPDHPEYELAQRQMPSGAGGVLAFELADGMAAGQLRGGRSAGAQRDQPRRRRVADRAPGAHRARRARARGPAAARGRTGRRRRPLGRPRPGDRGVSGECRGELENLRRVVADLVAPERLLDGSRERPEPDPLGIQRELGGEPLEQIAELERAARFLVEQIVEQPPRIEGRLAGEGLGVDREPRFPLRAQHVAAMEVLVQHRRTRRRSA